MDSIILSSFAIIIFAALIHASFQISVSVLTLISGHSLGRKTAHKRLLSLMSSFILGILVLTVTLLSTITYYFSLTVQHSAATEQLVAAVVCGLLFGLGVATWSFYYRRGSGTSLWLPREFARYLSNRTKQTKSSPEAFGLGMTSVIAELVFIIAPMMAAALAIITLPSVWMKIAGILTYVIISLASVLTIFTLVGSGHKISRMQAWRENNKKFIQFAAGGSLLILASFIFVDRLLGISIYGVF